MTDHAIVTGKVEEILKDFGDNLFDAVLCDPPYELSHDGKASPARVLTELLFPENPSIKTDSQQNCMLSSLVAEVLALSVGRLSPGPSTTMPEVPVTLNGDASGRQYDINNVSNPPTPAANNDGLLDEESKGSKHLGCFQLECTNTASALYAFNGSGACFDACGVGVGFVISAASLPSLLGRSGVINNGNPDIRTLYDALTARISATAGAEKLSVACTLSLTRDNVDTLPAGCALQFLSTLKLGGAKLVRARTAAGRLPVKLEARRVRIVSDATHRTLTLDLIVHPQSIAGSGFMGKSWDGSKDAFKASLWAEVLRVCKPGAALMAFGGTRTYHRMVCAIEDGGFEIRDGLMWLYGSGFPKSLDISKALDRVAGEERPVTGVAGKSGSSRLAMAGDFAGGEYMSTAPVTAAAAWSGWGTALKPAWEPITLARKPMDGTVAENVQRWGCGGLAIDACRIGTEEITINRFDDGMKPFGEGAGHPYTGTKVQGRWPANVILDEEAGAALDAQTGNRPGMSGGGKHKEGYPGGMFGGIDSEGTARGDNGGPSRFFYSAKVSKKERDAGLESFALKTAGEMTDREEETAGLNSPRAGAGRSGGARNNHPTLKPIALTTYLARLLLPPPGRVRRILVPFSGAGSEMIGACLAGWDEVIGVEQSSEYVEIAEARIKHWVKA